MTVSEIRKLERLAKQLKATLFLDYHGSVIVQEIDEPEADDAVGWVNLVGSLGFAGTNWEYDSRKDSKALKNPRFVLESGEEITVQQALAMVDDKPRKT